MFLGIPLIGWLQIIPGIAILAFMLVMYLRRPKANKTNEWLITDVHVIIGDGSEKFHQYVYIKDEKIQSISVTPLQIKRANVINGSGKTLMPGLIDSHVHIQGMHNSSEEESDAFLYGTIPDIFQNKVFPYGITTIKDLCAPRHFIYKLRDAIRKGKISGPRLLIVGPNFTAPNGHPANTLGSDNPWIRKEMAIEADSPQQIHEGIEELKKSGVDFLKFTYQGGDYPYFGNTVQISKLHKDLMEQIIDEGKKNGLLSTAHVFYKEDVRELLQAGIYGIEHGILDESLSKDDEIISLWKANGTHFVPTVNAMTYEPDPQRLVNSLHNLKVLYDAGIFIAMGTDTMYEMMDGEAVHQELAYYVEAGLTPMEAIVTATKNSAEHLGILQETGTVTEGKYADLILIDGDPSKDISDIRMIDQVFHNGKCVYAKTEIRSYPIPAYAYENSNFVLSDGTSTSIREIQAQAQTVQQTIQDNNGMVSQETFINDEALSCLEWTYQRPGDHTDLSAHKEDGTIILQGTFKGKKTDKKFRIDNGLWYQMMDLAIPAFIHSDEQQIIFYSIGTGNNRGAMGLGEFAAEKDGTETVTVNGISYQCIRISFVLTAFSWAWKGLYWYDVNDDRLIQSGEKRGGKTVIQYQIKER